MSYGIRVSPRAAAQIRAAADWWLENRPKVPQAFAQEIERGFELIRALPSSGEPVPHTRLAGVRRIHLGRVHYHLYYVVSHGDQMVEILALWHTSRGTAPGL